MCHLLFRQKFVGYILYIFLFLLICGGYTDGYAEQQTKSIQKSTVKQIDSSALEQAFREHPDIILNFLRDHSEELLDIAQEGAAKRRDKSLYKKWQEELETPRNINLKNHPVRGAQNAPVTIVAFSDFTCAYCARAQVELQKLMEKYPQKIRYVFKSFPRDDIEIDTLAVVYFMAAAQQDEEKAWALHDMMFASQKEILKEGERALMRLAEKLGLNTKKLAQATQSSRIRGILDDDMDEALRLYVEGTPTFFINKTSLP